MILGMGSSRVKQLHSLYQNHQLLYSVLVEADVVCVAFVANGVSRGGVYESFLQKLSGPLNEKLLVRSLCASWVNCNTDTLMTSRDYRLLFGLGKP
jgi:hypothetical protein